MTASSLYKAGQLDAALAAALEQVRNKPGDLPNRWLLTELLSFTGDVERADKQANALLTNDEKSMSSIAVYRQTLRAEGVRQQVFAEGRLPAFVGPPDEDLKLRLQASVALRAGANDEAARLLTQAETSRRPVSGEADGVRFDDFRDLDDLFSFGFEVLTTTGNYYWVPTQNVESIEFTAPKQPRDLIWRTARMILRDGPDGEVMMPCLYPGTHLFKTDDQLRLGRATTWNPIAGDVVRGAGLRTFLVGEQDRTILELSRVNFDKVSQ